MACSYVRGTDLFRVRRTTPDLVFLSREQEVWTVFDNGKRLKHLLRAHPMANMIAMPQYDWLELFVHKIGTQCDSFDEYN